MASGIINSKRNLRIVVLALFISGMLVLSLPTTFLASAGGTLGIQPAEGDAGILVSVNGGGFSGRTAIYFDGTRVTTATASSNAYGSIQASFHVPDVPAGTYNVTATDQGGTTAQTTFTVTGSDASPSPSPSSSPSASTSETATPAPSASTYSSASPSGSSTPRKTYHPTASPAANAFGSPLVIGGIVAAAAVAFVLVAFMLRARGKPKPSRSSFESEPPMPYRPQPPPPTTPATSRTTPTTVASRYTSPSTYGSSTYGPSSRPTAASRPVYTPSYSQQPSYATKTCPHCKRAVRVDYNICPYCYKRIK